MEFSIRKIDEASLDLMKRNNRQKRSEDSQNKELNSLEQFDLVSLNNKEVNKQNLQITAELISLAQNNKRNNFEEAYGEYLTQKWNNSQDTKNNETLEVLKVFFNIVSKSLSDTLSDFGKKVANMFDIDILSLIGSGILNMGSLCVSLCEAAVNSEEKRVMCPEFSFQ
jgi:hypothetical protein